MVTYILLHMGKVTQGPTLTLVDVQRTESLYKVKDFLCNYFFSSRSLAIDLSLENITSFRKQRFQEPIHSCPSCYLQIEPPN